MTQVVGSVVSKFVSNDTCVETPNFERVVAQDSPRGRTVENMSVIVMTTQSIVSKARSRQSQASIRQRKPHHIARTLTFSMREGGPFRLFRLIHF